MKKILLILVISIIGTVNVVKSQTNPAPFDLRKGNYSLTSWDSLATVNTYPSNMIFRWIPLLMTAPFYKDSASTNYNLAYNLTSGPRFNGLGKNGISVITTKTSASGTNEFTGSILLALNTTNRKNLQVSWESQTLTVNPRAMSLRLQYRVDSTGLYTDVPGPVQFTSTAGATGLAAEDSLKIGPTALPVSCENQPYVELRWIYFESDGMALSISNKRGRIRIDNINVTSTSSIDGIFELSDKSGINFVCITENGQLSINTSYKGKLNIKIYDMLGKLIYVNFTDISRQSLQINTLKKGVYLVSLFDEQTNQTASKKVVVF